ncbi:hypothetical protein NM688_g1562 [Phlebia brevispora]|uniref:Uncharacterized protein n=1 Tax=Phlebia brevispora TaxID=194682 RepID=A0ACC1TBB5_9APHY|nr:hypothetical protein NM688_g1562 [Phlebia brevispora]
MTNASSRILSAQSWSEVAQEDLFIPASPTAPGFDEYTVESLSPSAPTPPVEEEQLTPNIDGELLYSEEEEGAEDRMGKGFSATRNAVHSAHERDHHHPLNSPRPLMTTPSSALREFKESDLTTAPSAPVTIPEAVSPHRPLEALRKCLDIIEEGILDGHIKLSEGLLKRYEEQYSLVCSLADISISNLHILHGYATFVLHLEDALEQVDNCSTTCQRAGTTSLPLVAVMNSRTNFLPELQGKAKYATTGRRNSEGKPRNLYRSSRLRRGLSVSVVSSRQQVHSGVSQPWIVPMPDTDEDGGESDGSDSKTEMSFHYWGTDEITLQKPTVESGATPSQTCISSEPNHQGNVQSILSLAEPVHQAESHLGHSVQDTTELASATSSQEHVHTTLIHSPSAAGLVRSAPNTENIQQSMTGAGNSYVYSSLSFDGAHVDRDILRNQHFRAQNTRSREGFDGSSEAIFFFGDVHRGPSDNKCAVVGCAQFSPVSECNAPQILMARNTCSEVPPWLFFLDCHGLRKMKREMKKQDKKSKRSAGDTSDRNVSEDLNMIGQDEAVHDDEILVETSSNAQMENAQTDTQTTTQSEININPQPFRKDDIKTEYHSRSKRGVSIAHFAQYGTDKLKLRKLGLENEPWAAFKTKENFEFTELALICNVSAPDGKFTIESYSDLQQMWKWAAVVHTPFEQAEISLDYEGEHREYPLHYRNLWDWILDQLGDPQLTHFIEWDAKCLYKWSGTEWIQFVHEPCTGAKFWEAQSSLPDDKGKIVGILLYVDKTKLSTFGTQKGYPVILRILNLPSSVRNDKGVGSGIRLLPRWRNLDHFKRIMNVDFSDGQTYQDLSKSIIFASHNVLTPETHPAGYLLLRLIRCYLEIDMYLGLEVHTTHTLAAGRALKKTWAELLENHAFDDIWAKGTTKHYNTKPNESLHGPLKDAYNLQTNFKNVASQILRIEEYCMITAFIRAQMHYQQKLEEDAKMEKEKELAMKEREVDRAECEGENAEAVVRKRNGREKIQREYSHIQRPDKAFERFRIKLQSFLDNVLSPSEKPNSWQIRLKDDQIVTEYRFLRTRYESAVTWQEEEDLLRCNPHFYGAPRYDGVIINLGRNAQDREIFLFAKLLYIFTITISSTVYSIALILPLDARTGARSQKDKDLQLHRRGVALVEDVDQYGDYFIWDIVDDDIFLRIKFIFLERKLVQLRYLSAYEEVAWELPPTVPLIWGENLAVDQIEARAVDPINMLVNRGGQIFSKDGMLMFKSFADDKSYLVMAGTLLLVEEENERLTLLATAPPAVPPLVHAIPRYYDWLNMPPSLIHYNSNNYPNATLNTNTAHWLNGLHVALGPLLAPEAALPPGLDRVWRGVQALRPPIGKRPSVPDLILVSGPAMHGSWSSAVATGQILEESVSFEEAHRYMLYDGWMTLRAQPRRCFIIGILIQGGYFRLYCTDRQRLSYSDPLSLNSHRASLVRILACLFFSLRIHLEMDATITSDVGHAFTQFCVSDEWYTLSVGFSASQPPSSTTVCWNATSNRLDQDVKIRDFWISVADEQPEERPPIIIVNNQNNWTCERMTTNAIQLGHSIVDTVSSSKSLNKQELCLRIVCAIEGLAELLENEFLHCNMSPDSIVFKCAGSSHTELDYRPCFLVDIEHSHVTTTPSGVEITNTDSYDKDARAFRAIELLRPEACSTNKVPLLVHTFTHDLESLLHILIWICTNFSGPNNMERKDMLNPQLWALVNPTNSWILGPGNQPSSVVTSKMFHYEFLELRDTSVLRPIFSMTFKPLVVALHVLLMPPEVITEWLPWLLYVAEPSLELLERKQQAQWLNVIEPASKAFARAALPNLIKHPPSDCQLERILSLTTDMIFQSLAVTVMAPSFEAEEFDLDNISGSDVDESQPQSHDGEGEARENGRNSEEEEEDSDIDDEASRKSSEVDEADEELFGEDPDVKKLQETLKFLCLKNMKLTRMNRKLTEEVLTLKDAVTVNVMGKSASKGKASLSPRFREHFKIFCDTAKRMVILYSPWAEDDEAFSAPRSKTPIDVWSELRYDMTDAQLQANVEELHLSLKQAKLGRYLGHSTVTALIRYQMQQFRSNSISHCKKNLFRIFADIAPDVLRAIIEGKYSDDKVRSLWVDTESSSPNGKLSCMEFPPALFKNYQYDENMRGVFQCEAIPKVIRIIFFSTMALEDDHTPKSNTNGMKLGLTGITIGTVAFAAISLIYLISGDPAYTDVGKVTGIKYHELFKGFKALLIQKKDSGAQGAKWVKDLLTSINEFVFRKTAVSKFDSLPKVAGTSSKVAAFLKDHPDDESAPTVTAAASATDCSAPLTNPAQDRPDASISIIELNSESADNRSMPPSYADQPGASDEHVPSVVMIDCATTSQPLEPIPEAFDETAEMLSEPVGIQSKVGRGKMKKTSTSKKKRSPENGGAETQTVKGKVTRKSVKATATDTDSHVVWKSRHTTAKTA